MRRLLLSLMVAGLGMLAAAPAFATHFETVTFNGDCNGWNADVTVRIYFKISSTPLAYNIAIEDPSGNVLLESTGDVMLVDDNADYYASVHLSQFWNEITNDIIPLYGPFNIHATFTLVPNDENHVDSPPYEVTVPVECAVVPNEDVSWGAAKSAYR